MLKKSIEYTDLNGNKQTDECYFHMSKEELTQMEASKNGGFENYIVALMEEKDTNKIYELFREIVLMSYGKKSADGRRFIKKEMRDGQLVPLRYEFEDSIAFSEIMMELINGGEKVISDFVNAIIPKDLAEQVAKQVSEGTIKLPNA